MSCGDWYPPPGMIWSDAIGWYMPVFVSVLVPDRNSTSGERLELVPYRPVEEQTLKNG